MWRLLFPLKYFALHNREKSRIDIFPALVLGAVICIPYIIIPDSNFFEQDGFLDKVMPLSSALTAFYVAALVAVATFSHPDLDREIKVGAIYVVEKGDDGKEKKDFLTRRQFACIIFGYLAFISMVLSVAAAVIVPLSPVPVSSLPDSLGKLSDLIVPWRAINSIGMVLFGVTVAHMMVVTGVGLFYLMERIHDRAPVVLTKKRAKSQDVA